MQKTWPMLKLSCGLRIHRALFYRDRGVPRSTWQLVNLDGFAVADSSIEGETIGRILAAKCVSPAARTAFERFLGVIAKVQSGRAFVGWDWSYPTSPNADQFNGGAGCWTVHWRPVPAFNGCDTVTLGVCESGPDAEAFVALMEPKENGVLAFEPVAA